MMGGDVNTFMATMARRRGRCRSSAHALVRERYGFAPRRHG